MNWTLAMLIAMQTGVANPAQPAAALAPARAAVASPQPSPATKVRRDIPAGQHATTPLEAARLALADARTLGDSAEHVRYVWAPDWIEPASAFGQVSLAANSTISRTSNIIQPKHVTVPKDPDDAGYIEGKSTPKVLGDAGYLSGTIYRLDLDKFAADESQIDTIVDLYESLASLDSWFSERTDFAAGSTCEIRCNDGKFHPATFVSREGDKLVCSLGGKNFTLAASEVRTTGQHVQPATYLGDAGRELADLTDSDVPIMRLDEWVAKTFASINRGQYYKLAGVRGNLEDTIRDFCGNDAADKVERSAATMRAAAAEANATGTPIANVVARLDPELAKSKCYISTSGVTGRQRMVLFVTGTGVAPAIGQQIVAVTFDIGEDTTAADNDPLRSPLNYQSYDGGEAIFAAPNGLLVYLIFDSQDKILNDVPAAVAADTEALKIRTNVSTTRVFSGVSCANCHEKSEQNYGWQPVVNNLRADKPRLFRLLDDDSQRSQLKAQQRGVSQFSGDPTPILDLARLPYQHQAQLATRQETSRETVKGLADSYWGHLYDVVTPAIAVRDLTGDVLDDKAAQAWLIEHLPADELDDTHELLDSVAARLAEGESVNPAQWRDIYPETAALVDLELEGVKP